MRLLYSIFIYFYRAGIAIAAFWNVTKAKKWIAGRKNYFTLLQKEVVEKLNKDDELIWFHCASLGEFEQGRTLIERYKVQGTRHKILLTFFSPSGYEVKKNYEYADFLVYLPIDTLYNANRFLNALPIKAVFFVKYEFWFNYLYVLKNKGISTFLISGIFRPQHYFFKWYGKWALKNLKTFTHFFVQDETSKKLLDEHGYTNNSIAGDTRFDRVIEIASAAFENKIAAAFSKNAFTVVCGSTWGKDESIIDHATNKIENLKLIIAPHEINEAGIEHISHMFGEKNTVRYSEANEETVNNYSVLIIDNVGMLSSLYQYGQLAYIGGGFDSGIHNILEPATFGLPVFFGPNYNKFNEAHELIHRNLVATIKNENELQTHILALMNDAVLLKQKQQEIKQYMKEESGATEKIMSQLKKQFNF